MGASQKIEVELNYQKDLASHPYYQKSKERCEVLAEFNTIKQWNF